MPVSLTVQYMLFCLSGLTVLHFLRRGYKVWQGHFWLHTLISLLLLMGIALGWHQPVSLLLQAVLVVLPVALHRSIQTALQKAVMEDKLESAESLARLQVRLFPFAFHRQTLALVESLVRMPSREDASVRETLNKLLVQLSGVGTDSPETFPVQNALELLSQLNEQTSRRAWDQVLSSLQHPPHPFEWKLLPGSLRGALLLQKIRALSELDRLEEGLEAYAEVAALPLQGLLHRQSLVAALGLLALGGCKGSVDLLLSHPLRNMKMEPRILWLARAAWGAGQFDEARSMLTRLSQRPDLVEPFRQTLQERLVQLEVHPPAHNFTVQQLLTRLEHQVRLEVQLFPDLAEMLTRRPVTRTVLGVLLAVELGVLISGQRSGLISLLGATPLLLSQEPWRIVTGLLIQTSGIHWLALSIPALWWGGSVEGKLGGRRTALLFGLSGLATLAVGLWLQPLKLLVGPDGGLAGWFGAHLGLSFWGANLSQGQRKRLQERSLITFVLLCLLELVSPNTSVPGLAMGLGLGLLAGRVWGKRKD